VLECVLSELVGQRFGDQFLVTDVDFELDVVFGGLIHLHWFLTVVPQHFAGGASRFNGGVEIMGHERLARTKNTKCTTKTNRRADRPHLTPLPGARRAQVAGVWGIRAGDRTRSAS